MIELKEYEIDMEIYVRLIFDSYISTKQYFIIFLFQCCTNIV